MFSSPATLISAALLGYLGYVFYTLRAKIAELRSGILMTAHDSRTDWD
jgi:hypothetical protein